MKCVICICGRRGRCLGEWVRGLGLALPTYWNRGSEGRVPVFRLWRCGWGFVTGSGRVECYVCMCCDYGFFV